ncbi:2-dehydropantoate 2-reductase [Alkalihalophilus lindianensis]|uniref:2-dehydropantoate 2-reductase n=1 Tax=Alkalihalophilus lindianensis TaxID=1630542 RepID=A0ABU3X715_9BACI|nr:2-dehydropantoate 2-reductase [Alkalihalophilus lindianensis]MDV2683693.1 2-dehydropantoate 2-reductase [Alkalihalophilus lindianensis]
MKIAVIGAGAVGGYYGGMLSKAGFDVTFIARGKHLEAMKHSGLHIHSLQDSFIAQRTFTNDFNQIKEADLLLFTVKSTETKATAEMIHPLLKKGAAILTLQNGVDNEEILINTLGSDRIVSGSSYLSASVEQPGVIRRHSNLEKIIFGGLSETSSHHIESFVHVLQLAKIDFEVSSSIIEKKWEKLLWNATFNPLTAASLASVGDVLDKESLRRTAEAVLAEVVSVAGGLGIKLNESWVKQIFPLSEVARNHKTSMLQDLEKGKKMEVESICGYIIKKGKQLGIKTPVLETIYTILCSINDLMESKNTEKAYPSN